ncbi:hypothetical protein Emag_001414 [Eimeria magna]
MYAPLTRKRKSLLSSAPIWPFNQTVHSMNAVCTDRGLKRDEDLRWRSLRRENACTKLHRVTSFGTRLPLSTLWLLFMFCIFSVFYSAAASPSGKPPQLDWGGSEEDGGYLILYEDLHFDDLSRVAVAHSTPAFASNNPHEPHAGAALRHLETAESAAREEDDFFGMSAGETLAQPQLPATETSPSDSPVLQLAEIYSSKEEEIHQEDIGIEEEEDGALVSDERKKLTTSLQQCVLNDEGTCAYEDACDLNAVEEDLLSASNDSYASDYPGDAVALNVRHTRQQHGIACPPNRRMQQLDVSSLGPAAQYAQYVNTFMPAGQQRQQLQLLQQAVASGALGGAANLAALKRLQRRAQAAAYANSVSSHPLVQGVVRTALTAVADILGGISVADVVQGAVGGALMAPVAPLI